MFNINFKCSFCTDLFIEHVTVIPFQKLKLVQYKAEMCLYNRKSPDKQLTKYVHRNTHPVRLWALIH